MGSPRSPLGSGDGEPALPLGMDGDAPDSI